VPGDSSFADGLGEAVTQKLAGIGGLRVMDPASVASAVDGGARVPSPQTLGRALGADYVLRAVVRWRAADAGGQGVQIAPVLVRVADGTTRWAGEPLRVAVGGGDPFRAQAELAARVAEALAWR
jgi:TolB-like protein